MISQKNVLVTGGAGFIGSNLIQSLLKAGNKVICLDNFSTGHQHNISEFSSNSQFSLIEGDIRDFSTCTKACENIDIIFHHAALGSVPRSIADPISTTQVNIEGFVNILTAAKDAQVQKVIYASSSSTYGDADYSPKIEAKKGNLLSPYAVSKQTNDLFAQVFSRTYGIQTIGLCYFNVFGPKQDPNGAYAAVIPKFINILLQHNRPTIYGDGLQSRDFTYIDNVVHANLLAASSSVSNPHEHINIACGESITLHDLTDHIIQTLGTYDSKISSIKPIFGEPRLGDIPHSLASIEKAQKLLHYTPLCTVREGIEKTISWFITNKQ
ncbi:MAG: SDR family oxidoreductase [Bacteroidales bacterium]|jgi:UDP-N-acetylglucosamine 4-epimerase|nr:SDR family oxidoreductase [Bacteroidales bacterium]